MALLQENLGHTMVNGNGRPSPSFLSSYGHGFVAQPNGGGGGVGGEVPTANGCNGRPGQGGGHYGQEMAPYHHHHHHHHQQQQASGFGTVPVYDNASPSLQQQQQLEDGANGIPTPLSGQGWHYPGQLSARSAHGALDEWSHHYFHAAAGHVGPLPNGEDQASQAMHPHHHQHLHAHYNNYPYRVPGMMDGYDPHHVPPPHHSVMEPSPNGGDSSSSPGGPGGGGNGASGGGGGMSGTKQLRPPFEWMKPANLQPAPGKTRTKDKYRVVYSDHQRLELEKEFHFSRYITIRRKAEIAQQLNLSERQVKIWFQNRRAKERKQNKKKEQALRTSVPKLEPLDSPPPIAPQHAHHPHAPSPNMAVNINQLHFMSQNGGGGGGSGTNGGLSVSNSHLPSSLHPQQHHHQQQQQQQHYSSHRLSPLPPSAHNVAGHEGAALPHSTPSISGQLSEQVSPINTHPSHTLVTSGFQEKQEPV